MWDNITQTSWSVNKCWSRNSRISVKNFKGQRANTSARLTPYIYLIQCNSVVQLKSSLWDHFACNLKGKAVIWAISSSPCTVDASGVVPENIEKFLVFQNKNSPFLQNDSFSSRILQFFSSGSKREPVSIEIISYSYSDGIASGNSLDRFKKDCILQLILKL